MKAINHISDTKRAETISLGSKEYLVLTARKSNRDRWAVRQMFRKARVSGIPHWVRMRTKGPTYKEVERVALRKAKGAAR